MDLDNFDFKPLTSGLGFDKKAEQARVEKKPLETTAHQTSIPKVETAPTPFLREMKPQQPELFERSLDKEKIEESSRTIKDMLNSLPPSLDFLGTKTPTTNRNYNPVGRQEYITLPFDTPSTELKIDNNTAVTKNQMDISLDNTLEKAFPKVGFRKPFFHQTVEVRQQFTPVTTSFTSAVIDALVISGLTALFLVSLIVFTKIDLIAVLLHTQAPMSIWLEVGAIFCGVYLFYYMGTRGFWGSTLGDWAFDIQLGLESDRLQWYYPAVVIGRMALVAMTGFIFLPLVSFILKKDVLGALTGIGLYTKNY